MKKIIAITVILFTAFLSLCLSGNPPFVYIGHSLEFAYKDSYEVLEYSPYLKYLKNTKKLVLTDNINDVNLDFLYNMRKIEYLKLDIDCSETDFSPVSSCENLEYFISDNGIKDIGFLEKSTKLKYLEINPYSIDETGSLDKIKNLTDLEYISLPVNENINYSVFENFSELKHLVLGGHCGELSELILPNSLKSIKFCTYDADVSSLCGVQNIEDIDFYAKGDITFLKKFKNLKSLSLFYIENENIELSVLSELENIETLRIYASEMSDCSVKISELLNVKTLNNIKIHNIDIIDEWVLPEIKEQGKSIEII